MTTSHSTTSSPLAGDLDHGSTSGKGTWTKDEHERFLQATEMFPQGPWKKIAEMVRTRTIRQTQTHAQKYREKLARHHRGLRTRSFGQTSTQPPMSTSGMHAAPRHLPPPTSSSNMANPSKSSRNVMLLPPSGANSNSNFHHSPHHTTSSSHLRPTSHVPSHHHNHHSMLWAPPQLPQLHSSTPSSYSHENSASFGNNVHMPLPASTHHHHHHSLPTSSSFPKQDPPAGQQNFSQSMQYLMDFYEPANPPQHAAHFPIEHNNNHSYTVYNDPVDIYRRHTYQGDA
ncbi:hypothetical protein DYB34_009425 [Aphanomyces astaci]|uniref:Uncharacterized protein n=1 Tax=Aphanomyces astaci TaxID=112090 RepID=A0A3R7AU21_APHAT|nr:hypothetical protein DYB34_009425 [Aphanomyces astaci]